jgi:hypothetical protein
MAFIVENEVVISFAEYKDVLDRDSRLFDNNESLTDTVVEDSLIRATEKVLNRIKGTDWWVNLYRNRVDGGINVKDIPTPEGSKVIDRINDFTDLCVYTALAEYILPSVADFGLDDNSERRKMGYYENRRDELFMELIRSGDWYDFDGDNNVSTKEKEFGNIVLKRIR